MREFEDEADLTARMKEKMTGEFASLAVDWPMTKTKPSPQDGVLVRFRIARLADSRFIATQGAIKHYRNYGSVLIQVVGPNGNGPGQILKLAGKLGGFFQSWRKGGLLCRTSAAGPVIESTSTSSLTVSIPYQSDYKVDEEGNVLP